MTGLEIAGFKFLEEIGQGGMGKVYKAYQASLERYVAIKTIPLQLASDETLLARFYTEAKTLAKLNHPNIIGVYDIFEQKGIHYIAMEYVEGVTLGTLIRQKGSLGEEQALFFLDHLIDALATAHDNGIIHRDIKPDNVMVSRNNRVKLMDFGLARNPQSSGRTMIGHIMGTPEYMSPAQCEGRSVDGQTDLYALGITIFEILVGKTPFTNKNVGEIIHAKTCGEAPKLEHFYQDASPELNAIVNKMIEHDPKLRYNTAHEIMRDLQPLSGGKRLAPDQITVLSQSMADTPPPTLVMTIQQTLTKDVREWTGRQAILLITILGAVMIGLSWGAVKIKRHVTFTQEEQLKVDAWLVEAREFTAQGKYSQAKERLDNCLDLAPWHEEATQLDLEVTEIMNKAYAYYTRGIASFDDSDWQSAIAAFESVIALYPHSYKEKLRVNIISSYSNLANELVSRPENIDPAIRRRNIEQANVYNLKALEYDPGQTVVLRNIALNYHGIQDYENCLKFGKLAMEANEIPSNPDEYFGSLSMVMGLSAIQLKDFDRARSIFEESIDLVLSDSLKTKLKDYIERVNIEEKRHQQAKQSQQE